MIFEYDLLRKGIKFEKEVEIGEEIFDYVINGKKIFI